ncbi:MAG: ClbS/DfsB family four-helix bundle protein, partial [Hyphomicrobiales bacterium]
IERIEASRQKLDRLIASAPPPRLERPGADGWSAKDHLAHLAAWERSLVALIEGRPRHRALDLTAEEYRSEDTDAVNAKVYERRAAWRLAQVLSDYQGAHEACLEALARLSDEDLRRGYSHFQPDEPGEDTGKPITDWICGNTCDHFDEHREYIEALLAP